MRWTVEAVRRLRTDLEPIETYAAGLAWAETTPWRARDRVATERRLWVRRDRDQRIVRVDLHGLDAEGARQACEQIRAGLLEPGHPLRYVRLVVGKGKRSVEGRRVLAGVAARVLVDEPPLRTRSSTVHAPDGFLDVWHQDRWPRPRLTSRRR